MRVQTKIKKWGNSLALRLSGPMNVHVTEEGLAVKLAVSKKKNPYRLVKQIY